MADIDTLKANNHVLPLGTYLLIGASLLILTAITVYISFFSFGEWNLIVAMAVAAAKATLVALFFMHLLYDKKIFSIVFIGALLFLAIFIVFTMLDTMNRDDLYELRGETVSPNAVIYDQSPAGVADSMTVSDSVHINSTSPEKGSH